MNFSIKPNNRPNKGKNKNNMCSLSTAPHPTQVYKTLKITTTHISPKSNYVHI